MDSSCFEMSVVWLFLIFDKTLVKLNPRWECYNPLETNGPISARVFNLKADMLVMDLSYTYKDLFSITTSITSVVPTPKNI